VDRRRTQGQLADAQALRYAEELRELHASERAQRRQVEQTLARLEDSYGMTVRALAAALELRDDVTGNHAQRVTALALHLAERVAPRFCEDPQLEYGFLLHDVGKIGVPDSILLKVGALEVEERRVIELHPLHGERILAQVPYLGGVARDVVLSHHERWDGGGYPYQKSGTGIPLAARIFALADSFDALTNDRPYRRALPVETALEEIESQAGLQFDPELTPEFVALVRRAGSA
jgi:HD-GYP domain-containing protein (c-di-GMP phosphodiesterase class II)